MESAYTYFLTSHPYPTLWRRGPHGWELLGSLAWRSGQPEERPCSIPTEEAESLLASLRREGVIARAASTELTAALDEERGGPASESPADLAKKRELEGLLIGLGVAGLAAGATAAVAVGLRHKATAA